jgi:protein-tyrosine-phosphatase/DNA-binding transcriptional ArsR family regulator
MSLKTNNISIMIESMQSDRVQERAQIHAALGDAHRLAIVDELVLSDRSPSELRAMLGIDSNLIAHHLDVLERLKLIERSPSQGDRRRTYVRLIPENLADFSFGESLSVRRLVFVCTENVARSQLAAAVWNHLGLKIPAFSGGTHPKGRVHPGAVKAAARRGLNLRKARPGPIPPRQSLDVVITVCDRAHEALRAAGDPGDLHWSVPDPVAAPGPNAFEVAADLLTHRIQRLTPLVVRA